MTRTVRTETTAESPKALIFGLGTFIDPLSKELTQKGCLVRKELNQIEDLGSYNYIFLTDISDVALSFSHLLSSGKILVLVKDPTQKPEIVDPKLKIVAVGDPQVWDPDELASQLVKSIFSAQKGVVDLRKKVVHAKPKEEVNAQMLYGQKTIQPQKNVTDQPSSVGHKPPRIQIVRTYNLKVILLAVFFLLSVLGVIALSTGLFVRSLISDVRELQSFLTSSQWSEARLKIKSIQTKVGGTRSVYEKALKVATPVKQIQAVSTLGSMLSTVDESLFALDETLVAFSSFSGIEGVSVTQNWDKTQITTMQERLNDLYFSLTKTKEQVESIEIPLIDTTEVKRTLTATLTTIEKARTLFPLYELIFSKPGKVRLLVLFQNNMELRPTGGFIGSYAIIEVENGRFNDFSISDVYTADGQLKGHVDPPLPIRKHLSQPNWFLRDSNFDPDFAVSARQAQWFLEKETGTKVDGVIGVNLFVLQSLLSAVGPVPLVDFGNEVISAENFFATANELIHSGFFDGSSQKKDFLTAVSGALQQRLSRLQGSQAIALLSSFTDMLEAKHILLFLSDQNLQNKGEQLGWAGRITAVSCLEGGTSCYPDYLAIVEANLGINKANYFVQKSIALEKHIDTSGTLSTTVTLSYENKSISSLNKGGTYVNYLRLLVPAGVAVQSVSLNNSPFPLADVDITSYGLDKTSIGFLVKIAPQNKGVVRVRYTLPRRIDNQITNYQLFYQKQGGDKSSPLVFSLTYPKEFILSPTNFTAHSLKEGELLYSTDTSVDRILMLKKK